jgi:hypothetical protein
MLVLTIYICKKNYKKINENSLANQVQWSCHIEGDIMQNHEAKTKVKKSKMSRFYGQNKLLS